VKADAVRAEVLILLFIIGYLDNFLRGSL